jgi:hypothetical protein
LLITRQSETASVASLNRNDTFLRERKISPELNFTRLELILPLENQFVGQKKWKISGELIIFNVSLRFLILENAMILEREVVKNITN